MKNWKKLLACLLVGLMALTVFTACDASVGAPMSPKRSDAESESVKALRDKFKMTYNVEMTYNEDLSEKLTALRTGSPAPRCPARPMLIRPNFTASVMQIMRHEHF